MTLQLGIDFGTSTTKIALRSGDGIPIPLQIGQGRETFMPSVVAYEKTDGDTAKVAAVGEDAASMFNSGSRCVIREIKRCLAAPRANDPQNLAQYDWWDKEDSCVRLWSSTFSIEEVVQEILAEAVDRAASRIRELGLADDIDSVSIRGITARFGCPVSAELKARSLIADVAKRLRFPRLDIRLIREEPVLASLAYSNLNPNPEDLILVYDLGGGSFDVAIVKVLPPQPDGTPSLTVLAADGEEFCGGVDLDKQLNEYLTLKISQEHLGFSAQEAASIFELMSPEEESHVATRAREAKERLSTEMQVEIAFPPDFLGAPLITASLSRAELVAALDKSGILQKTERCVLRAWRRTRMVLRDDDEALAEFHLHFDEQTGALSSPILGLRFDDLEPRIKQVLLVGGTTRIPEVRKFVGSCIGRDKIISDKVLSPLEAVAVGAAWQEANIGGVADRLPFSVLVCDDGQSHTLYEAYQPTVRYNTLTGSPGILPFTANLPAFHDGPRPCTIVLQQPDGTVIADYPCELRDSLPRWLEINHFGQCSIRNERGLVLGFENPSQHPLQREMSTRLRETEARRARAVQERGWEMMNRPAHLENN